MKRTALGALVTITMAGCASFESYEITHDFKPPEQDIKAHPDWIAQLDQKSIDLALGPVFDLVPQFDYQPGHYASTVPDYPLDIWQRMREGFKLEAENNSRIEQQKQLFKGRNSYFNALARRAEPYLYYMLNEIEERDMPTEVIALAVVESAFRPFAYSHGRAAGVWQFIPSTGRIFGLEMNYWYDGRRDIVASTEAALNYLGRLAQSFDGDWLLAMAAYNAGQGNVRAAQQRARAAGKEPHYWNLQLPSETMAYVPRIIAIRDIIQEPDNYQVSLPPITNEQRIRIVEADHQIDLALAAEWADISIDRLYLLNPGYNRWATAPEGPHRLVLPKEEADRLEAELAKMDRDELVEWRRHEVSSGETLSHIARQYNINVDLIQEINGLRDHSLRTGDTLYVPVSSRPPSEYSLSAANRLRALQQRNRAGERREHIVQPGETLWDISRSYNVSVRQLASWNGMAPGDTLRPNQKLVVWVDGEAIQAGADSPSQRKQTITYTVRRGDSLARIAQRFNVRVSELKRTNDIAEGSYLQPGQRLRIEVDVTQQGANL
ncbi:LysM peptidoglycan-binding domain-containing protein [Halorhodospira halochloris]|uniref:LysM peptidoglycan-binding domain-containing protein n=1 Tax=Halorhodospira halochloris TaxID=1052 RepID=UPI001EE953CD|nr:LysM peptidoglycan-binding domain-containing protein [Halorhodospira halochloris]MCG5531098.1 LysM peptidoglycan-binding domain-containing protein [Halorhodospira halochloris]